LRHSFQLEAEARAIETAVRAVLAAGNRTRDLAGKGQASMSTEEMGAAVSGEVSRMHSPVITK
jgi:3-isopropylmalate dehydrogenase